MTNIKIIKVTQDDMDQLQKKMVTRLSVRPFQEEIQMKI